MSENVTNTPRWYLIMRHVAGGYHTEEWFIVEGPLGNHAAATLAMEAWNKAEGPEFEVTIVDIRWPSEISEFYAQRRQAADNREREDSSHVGKIFGPHRDQTQA